MSNNLEYINIENLSNILGINCNKLLKLVKISPRLYHEIKIKKNNKTRTIEIPNSILKNTQKLLLNKVLYNLEAHPQLYGRQGTSIKKAVADHTRKPVVILIDIKNFFPSVSDTKIRKMLLSRNANKEIANIITRLCTYKRHLPLGAPTSPCIGRLVLNPFAINLDKMLTQIHPNAIFSVYVDDIIVSGPRNLRNSISTIYKILDRFGFKANEDKTKVMNKNDEQVALNICLNNRIEPTANYLKEVENMAKTVDASDPALRGKRAFIEYLFRN